MFVRLGAVECLVCRYMVLEKLWFTSCCQMLVSHTICPTYHILGVMNAHLTGHGVVVLSSFSQNLLHLFARSSVDTVPTTAVHTKNRANYYYKFVDVHMYSSMHSLAFFSARNSKGEHVIDPRMPPRLSPTLYNYEHPLSCPERCI